MKTIHPFRSAIALLLLTTACGSDDEPIVVATDPASSESTGEPDSASTMNSTTGADPMPQPDSSTGGELPSICGDGRVTGDEVCDDGINSGEYGGGCGPGCTAWAPRCGDGVVDVVGHEACDDGEANGTTPCNAWCELSGSILGELWGPDGFLHETYQVVRAPTNRLCVVTSFPTLLWEIAESPHGVLETVSITDLEPLLGSGAVPSSLLALADGTDRIVLAATHNLPPEGHELHVIDVSDPHDIPPPQGWGHSPGLPQAETKDLLEVGTGLWLIGDAYDATSDTQELWIHRFPSPTSPLAHSEATRWYGQNHALHPRGVIDPSTGYVAIFHRNVGLVAPHMRMTVRDPASGEEVFGTSDSDYVMPSDACVRPDGGLLVLAQLAAGSNATYAIGYRIERDGTLIADGVTELDFGPNTRLSYCTTGTDLMLLTGRVNGRSSAIAIRDIVGSQPDVVWQHSPIQIGLEEVQYPGMTTYDEGRFTLVVGEKAGVVVFAE